MNEKLNIQDLIDTLAERHGMSKKNADSFVKECFSCFCLFLAWRLIIPFVIHFIYCFFFFLLSETG